jgi:hypothetical protein
MVEMGVVGEELTIAGVTCGRPFFTKKLLIGISFRIGYTPSLYPR